MGGKAKPVPAGVRWLSALGGLSSVAVLVLYLNVMHLDRVVPADFPPAIYFIACLLAGAMGGVEMARERDLRIATPSLMSGLFLGLAMPTAQTLGPMLILACLPFGAAAGWLLAVGGQKPWQTAEFVASIGAGVVAGAVPLVWLG